MDTFCLVDFDNTPPHLRNGGVLSLAIQLRSEVLTHLGSIEDLYLRLYGGWYTASGLSRLGSQLTQDIATNFPIVGVTAGRIKTHLFCELASSIIDDKSQVLTWTHRLRNGIRSRLTPKNPQACAFNSSCPIAPVVQFSRGRCPIAGCGVKTEDAFSYEEQKLVDTLLCCDILALSLRRPAPAVFVVSDDDDLLPAFLMGAGLGGSIWRCRMRSNPNTFYDSILMQSNVQTIAI